LSTDMLAGQSRGL